MQNEKLLAIVKCASLYLVMHYWMRTERLTEAYGLVIQSDQGFVSWIGRPENIR